MCASALIKQYAYKIKFQQMTLRQMIRKIINEFENYKRRKQRRKDNNIVPLVGKEIADFYSNLT